MIDMILIRRKWATSVQQCRTFQGADIDSDHSLVMANIKIKLKKKHKAQFRKRRDIARLSDEGISNAYRVALERHLGQAEPSQDLDENAKRIAMAMEKAAEETIPEKEMITKKWITPETLSLVQEKRILKKKRDSSELADREYRQKCNEVRKAARADKANWLERQCEDIEKYYGEYKTREVYKMIGDINRKWQPKQRAIRDSNGK